MADSDARGARNRPAPLCFLVLGLLLPTCRPRDSARPRVPEHIFLVTIDTLRADHLPIYGYPRSTAPFLSWMAHRGIVFSFAHSASSHTGPSHASLLTSLYPSQHGLLRNGERMKTDVATLANVIEKAGYQTAAIGSVRFLQPVAASFQYRNFNSSGTFRRASETVDEAIAWLDGHNDGKTFLWIHLYDIHEHQSADPHYDAYVAKTAKSAFSETALAAYLVHEQAVDRSAFPSAAAMMSGIRSYDGRIRYVDAQIKRLFDHVAARTKRGRQTLWIVTADHGEGLGTHGYIEHGRFLYQEQIHVPLIVFHSGWNGRGNRVDSLVSLVDVAPTLAAYVGQKPDGRWQGRPVRPFGRREAGIREVFSERRPADQGRDNWGWERDDLFALVAGNKKLLWYSDGARQLYDLKEDPLEQRDLATEDPALAEAMAKRMEEWLKRSPGATRSRESTIDEKYRETLRSLGY